MRSEFQGGDLTARLVGYRVPGVLLTGAPALCIYHGNAIVQRDGQFLPFHGSFCISFVCGSTMSFKRLSTVCECSTQCTKVLRSQMMGSMRSP